MFEETDNPFEVNVSNINPDMFFGGAGDEQWTYTIFATQDTSIIPEPSSFALLLSALVACFAIRRRKISRF